MLSGDVQLTGPLTVAEDTIVVVDLNGHTLTAADGQRVFNTYGNVVVLDSSADKVGTIVCKDISDGTTSGDASATGYRGGCSYVFAGGSFTLYSGNIMGGKANRGGAFYIGGAADNQGKLFIYGGNVYGNTGTNRGHNIFVGQYSELYIYDGTVSSDAQTTSARTNIGIYRGKAYIYGGEITATGNQNIYVGGAAGTQNGELFVYGGRISSNQTSWNINAASSVVAVYNGRISGQDPTDFAAACTCVAQAGDSYTVFHARDTGTCDVCSVNEVTEEHTYTLVKGHDYSEDPLTCGDCGRVRATLDLTTVTLRPGAAGVYFSGSLRWDETDPEILACGIAVSTENPLPVADDSDASSLYTQGSVSVLVKDILKTENTDAENVRNARMTIYARAYIQLANGEYIYSDAVSVNLQQVVTAAQNKWDVLSTTQQDALLQMYATYSGVMSSWNVPNLKAA